MPWDRVQIGGCEVKITPRKPTDQGGILTMPLVENVLRPTDTTWKKTTCPKCGKACWDRPLPEGYQESMFDGKLCTLCALQMGVSKGGGR